MAKEYKRKKSRAGKPSKKEVYAMTYDCGHVKEHSVDKLKPQKAIEQFGIARERMGGICLGCYILKCEKEKVLPYWLTSDQKLSASK